MKQTKHNGDRPIINLKLILSISAILLIVILGISLFFIIDDASRTVTIRFLVAPSSATITLGGTNYRSAETYRIRPGNYDLSITKDGFDPYQKSLTLNDGDNLNIDIALEIQPGNENYYKEHPNEAYALETIWTNQMIAGSEVVLADNPLLNILPINVEYYIQNKQYIHYQISFRIDDPENVVVLINDYTGGNYDAALERIRTEGYDPDNYTIEYRDLSADYTGTDNF
ncbi:PEGA domain-containing protein [Candidatus Saccharibacteria bacterium]|nr:PEGA domain-containing protein [Candidatus Saccharibacteria bacterium]